MTDLDRMVQHYAGCAIACAPNWNSEDEYDNHHTLERDGYTIFDIAPSTLESMRADCAAFLAVNESDLREWNGHSPNGSEWQEMAGYHFWLTRNGHGAGFWDGDYPEPIGQRLTVNAHGFGEIDPYLGDDGLIYI